MVIRCHDIGYYFKQLGFNLPIKERKLLTIAKYHEQGVLSYLP
jgi:hypothetical protein